MGLFERLGWGAAGITANGKPKEIVTSDDTTITGRVTPEGRLFSPDGLTQVGRLDGSRGFIFGEDDTTITGRFDKVTGFIYGKDDVTVIGRVDKATGFIYGKD